MRRIASIASHAALLFVFAAIVYAGAPPSSIWNSVGVCSYDFPNRCLKPLADGSLNVNASLTPSGTQDVNLTKVAGVAVSQGHGTAATALRVELPTDGNGTLATVGAVTAITNALPAGTAILGKVGIDQTTPGTTNGVQVNAALPAGNNNIGDVDIATIPAITGTVTANAGTNLNTSLLALETGGNLAASATSLALLDNAIGTVAAGTAATNSYLAGGIFTNTLPTLTDGQGIALQVSSRGALRSEILSAGSVTGIQGKVNNADGVAVSSSLTALGVVSNDTVFNGTTWDRTPGNTLGVFQQGNVGSGVADTANPVKVGGRFNTSLPTLTNGQRGDAQMNAEASILTAQQPTALATAGITSVVSASAESNHVLKGSAGNLYGFQVTSGASAGYVMIFNATAAPGDGAVTPIKCYVLPANSTMGASWSQGPPLVFSTGITVVFSTTGCFSKTASATAFISGETK